jgi:hypothetical protein
MEQVQAEKDWLEEYHRRRDYLHLTEEQLCARYASLLENVIEFDDGGRPFIARSEGPHWTKRLCWTEEEFRFRSLTDRIAELQQQELDRPRPHVIAARKLWSRLDPAEVGSYLIKFSKSEYVREMLAKGRFRISPAVSYSDPSLNTARRDDELVAQVYYPRGTRLSVKIKEAEPYQELSGIVGPIAANNRCGNYYVFCASGRFDPRLFDDFEADACLLVRDIQQFGLRLIRGFGAAAHMTNVACGSVHYLDPLHPDEVNHLVEMTKNFRYEYQSEWRIAWTGEQPLPKDATPVCVDLGPLHDCCEACYL